MLDVEGELLYAVARTSTKQIQKLKWKWQREYTDWLAVKMKWRLAKREVCAVNAEQKERRARTQIIKCRYTVNCRCSRYFKIHVFCGAGAWRPALLPPYPLFFHFHCCHTQSCRCLIFWFVAQSVSLLMVSLYVSLPGPCCVVLAMIHLTRQHFIRDLRDSRGLCHLEPSVCPPGFGSFPLASGSRPPSTAFSFAWGHTEKK